MISKPIRNIPDSFRYRIIHFFWPIVRVFRNMKRAYDFAKIGAKSYDFDSYYLLELMVFKLQRIEKEIKKGHHEPSKETNQSLRITQKLLQKVMKDDYHRASDLHYKKWGHPSWKSKPCPDNPNLFIMDTSPPNAITAQDKAIERQEFRDAYLKDEKIKERDVKILFNVMAKYYGYWWE